MTLKASKRLARDDKGEGFGLFGQYAIHQNNGRISVNQEIEVLEYKRRNQSDKKYQLESPNSFTPHVLNFFFQSFRVLKNVLSNSVETDDPEKPREWYRLELEVERDCSQTSQRVALGPETALQVDTSVPLPTGKHVKVSAHSAVSLWFPFGFLLVSLWFPFGSWVCARAFDFPYFGVK
jgi:hypothetical protein